MFSIKICWKCSQISVFIYTYNTQKYITSIYISEYCMYMCKHICLYTVVLDLIHVSTFLMYFEYIIGTLLSIKYACDSEVTQQIISTHRHRVPLWLQEFPQVATSIAMQPKGGTRGMGGNIITPIGTYVILYLISMLFLINIYIYIYIYIKYSILYVKYAIL